jgi:hypothetical protein
MHGLRHPQQLIAKHNRLRARLSTSLLFRSSRCSGCDGENGSFDGVGDSSARAIAGRAQGPG